MMARFATLVHWLLISYITLLMIAAAMVVGLWKWQHVQIYSVQTGSMAPTFQPGDAVLVKHIDASAVQTGQVVSYISPANPRIIVSHRVTSVDAKRGLITTQGDNARRPDVAFSPNLVKGRVRAVLPYLGRLLNAMHTPWGLAIGVYLPASVVVLSELRQLAKGYNYSYYRLFGLRRA
jgi:signal peptidase I